MKSSNNDTVHTDTLASNAAKDVYNKAVLAVLNGLSSAVDLKTKNIIFKCIVTVAQDRTTAIEARTEMLLQFTKQKNIHQLLAIKAQQGKQSQSDDGSAWLDNNLRKQISKILNVENGMKLLEAIQHGSLSDVAKLLDKKDNIELTVKNDHNENAVRLAVLSGDCEILKLVLKDLISYINLPGKTGTVLHVVKSLEIAELLIANGANVNEIDHLGRKPLHRVWTKEIAELLIANEADVNEKDDTGKTALFYAKNPAIAKLFIDNGANVNEKDNIGCTALHWVSNPETAKVLIDNGANVNEPDNKGYTALHYASHSATIKVLLDHGAKIDQPNNNGDTPLITSLIHKDVKSATLLMDKGADITPKNHAGKDALDYAKTLNNVDIVETIKARLKELNNQALVDNEGEVEINAPQEEFWAQAEEQIDTVNATGEQGNFTNDC